ncbi:hypothetical protein HF086_003484 [Spodoptera exigua]|uniref:Elongation of very long chain fatty acids protein n=1 Tax=Spodoptera exigua TaxID=7107 RepID=A0A922MHN5_SPOEX|nr:hypothetical protein HF086_003484 [Spodoptera exigua]
MSVILKGAVKLYYYLNEDIAAKKSPVDATLPRLDILDKGHAKLVLANDYLLNPFFHEDPRTQDWFLIRTPWPGLFIMMLYLATIFRWLPDYMSKRPAYDLRRVIAAYNAIQIVGCAYIAYKSLSLGWLNHYSLICQGVDDGPHSVEYAWTVCYGYFIMKLVDLLDTLQFTLLLFHFISVVTWPECDFPRQPAYLLIPQNLFMVILFSDFYYRSYIKSKKT